jgi:hypothetical protein
VPKKKDESKNMPDKLYTPALADTIYRRIAEGESLRSIGRDPGMPSEGAVRGWARENRDGFGTRYRVARRLCQRVPGLRPYPHYLEMRYGLHRRAPITG